LGALDDDLLDPDELLLLVLLPHAATPTASAETATSETKILRDLTVSP